MRSTPVLVTRGAEYLRTVLGPPAVPHAGGELRVTSVDVYESGLHVHLYFHLSPQTTLTPAERQSVRQRLLSDWPECPPDQLDLFVETNWLADRVRSGQASDDMGTDYVGMDGGGVCLDRRALLMDLTISPRPPSDRCTIRWRQTAVQLDLRASAD